MNDIFECCFLKTLIYSMGKPLFTLWDIALERECYKRESKFTQYHGIHGIAY